MMKTKRPTHQYLASLTLLALLTACGGGSSSNTSSSATTANNPTARGNLNSPVVQVSSVTAAQLQGSLASTASGSLILSLAGAPKCGVTFNYMSYNTLGGKNEATSATGGILVPTGTDPTCSGPRPVLLYAHGTTVDKRYNFLSSTEGGLMAAMYAAQGWIVVAPNYAGYDASTLSYHPYLNAEQQANDMIDSLRAARNVFSSVNATPSTKLFLTGYSQGGFVAMATAKAMQSAEYKNEFTVTALGGMSGPYAPSNFLRTIFAGGVNLGGSIFAPLVFTSWQQAYGNLYSNVSDVYETAYATGIESLMPSATLNTTTLITTGKLPPYLFASSPLVSGNASLDALFAAGVGTPNLIKTSYRSAANAAPTTHPVWLAAAKNDLSSTYTPSRPTALCFGANDPVVYASNTSDAVTAFTTRGAGALVTTFDVESNTSVPAALAAGFQSAKTATASDPTADGSTPTEKVTRAYHGSLVPPFCNAAIRGYFQGIIAAGL